MRPPGRPARVPRRKPEAGRYHLVRFLRSDRRLPVYGASFLLPPETAHEYVVATVEVEGQRRLPLGADPVAEFPYGLR